MDLETKAYLLSIGSVRHEQPLSSERSTAGPGAGGHSIFFRSGDRQVRLAEDTTSPLLLERLEGEAILSCEGREVARGVLVEPLCHCPDQAYITVCERCIYNCKFCAVPILCGAVKSFASIEEMITRAAATGQLQAISLTSGVEVSPEAEVDRVVHLVERLGRFRVPIGVSVCPTKRSNQLLKAAGASEVKYNLETVDRDLFPRVCPGLSYDEIMEALCEAVPIFGRGHVFSNVIMGLGESDRVLMEGIDELAEAGILPTLRPVYPHPLRRGELDMVRPGPERLLRLARYAKRALDRSGLRGDAAQTMCYRCTGCDLVPGRDL